MLRPAAPLLVLLLTAPSIAAERCRIHEPAGKPIQLRLEMRGQPVAKLKHGRAVEVLDRASDRGGAPWLRLADPETGEPLGWAGREAVSCAPG